MSTTLPPRGRSRSGTATPAAPMPAPPVRSFSFTDFSTNNPTTPQPGNQLDSNYDQTNASVSSVITWASVSLNTDGTIRDASIDQNNLVSGLFDDISAGIISDVQPLVDEAQSYASAAAGSSTTAQAAATAADASNTAAQAAASTASNAASSATLQAQAANSSALAAQTAASSAADDADDAAGDLALCTDYGLVTQAWAEHMPDTIPPNILAVMNITGDHWSSRWWANKASAAFGELASLYLGAWPNPPLTTATGDPIPLGAIYYNTTSGQPFVWDGNEWVPFYAPTKACLLTLLYHATANQTAFPLTHPDLGGQTYVMSTVDPEPLEIYVNGDRLPQNAPNPGYGAWDVNPSTSTVTFITPLAAGAVVQIDILTPASSLTPTRVQTEALLDFNIHPGTGTPGQIDGVRTTFPLVFNDGAYTPVAAGSAQELFISLDGVVQQPSTDFSISGGNITFTEAPAVGARAWGAWYGPGHYGSETGEGYLPISGGTLTGALTLAADPVSASQAATKHYVDSASGVAGGPFLALAGGTMTGALVLAGNPTTATQAATKGYVDTTIGALPPYLPISGGTLTGPVTLSGNAVNPLHPVPLQQMNTAVAAAPFLPLAGGTVTGKTTLTGGLVLSGLPTSPTSLPAGTVWNNGGVLCVA